MKVTPVNKKFGKYAPGDEFEFPDKTAKIFIRLGKLVAVGAAPTYQTRMMQAEAPAVVQIERAATVESVAQLDLDSLGAEWNETLHSSTKARNTDGTWRKRPGPRSADE